MIRRRTFLYALTLSSLLSPLSFIHASGPEQLIAPEIKNDSFYKEIYKLSREENISSILEIGSSSGEGSTEAFANGIKTNPNHPTLFCMEVSKVRFEALQKRYADVKNVKCYNVSSVPVSAFPSESEISEFYNTTKSKLKSVSLDQVLGWLKQDIEYVESAGVPQTGIEIIKQENNIQNFDLVLIDGSEFTGKAELDLVYGARFILLDDIRTYKNYHNFIRLKKDPAYKLIKKNTKLRNGFAIFEKTKLRYSLNQPVKG